ncbi:MAG TPA: hypothetical protein VMB83_03670 [Roseiarcus sp.]|nr:hypothetical protein [Roseiarcus sp.]
MALASFADVKNFINSVLTQNKEAAGAAGSRHGSFWSNLTYQQFTTGNVPSVDPPVPILVIGNSAQSNLILALKGTGPLFDNNTGTYGQMPANGPPWFTDAQIAEVASWIDSGCPE